LKLQLERDYNQTSVAELSLAEVKAELERAKAEENIARLAL
jgi:hypothetical protein